MYLKELSLINFKNIVQSELTLSAQMNCFVGENGTGKTNLLDAIHYLSLCKSAFNLTDTQSIRHGEDFFMIEGRYQSDTQRSEELLCSCKRGAPKVFKRNGKEYDRLSEHIGLIPLVMISPSDTALISESGDQRRKYLNSFIAQLDSAYLNALVRYNHLLAERNQLLKQSYNANFNDILEILNMQMADLGGQIFARRSRLLDQLAPLVAHYYALLSNDREEVSLTYRSDLADRPFEALLAGALERDRANGFTTVGVHRDDMVMKIGGYPLRKYGSQGQQKSFLVALKLAQYDIVAAECGKKPILLLDDIFDKLDMKRVEQLITLVSDDRFGQIFITDCNKVRLEGVLSSAGTPFSLFEVVDGEIRMQHEKA